MKDQSTCKTNVWDSLTNSWLAQNIYTQDYGKRIAGNWNCCYNHCKCYEFKNYIDVTNEVDENKILRAINLLIIPLNMNIAE